MKKLFGKRLQELRKQRGLTQEVLSEMINIKPENYSRIENGLSFPKPQNIEKIAQVLNIDISELFKFNNYCDIAGKREQLIKRIVADDDTTLIVYEFLSKIGRI